MTQPIERSVEARIKSGGLAIGTFQLIDNHWWLKKYTIGSTRFLHERNKIDVTAMRLQDAFREKYGSLEADAQGDLTLDMVYHPSDLLKLLH